jgi:hypothetical protein
VCRDGRVGTEQVALREDGNLRERSTVDEAGSRVFCSYPVNEKRSGGWVQRTTGRGKLEVDNINERMNFIDERLNTSTAKTRLPMWTVGAKCVAPPCLPSTHA